MLQRLIAAVCGILQSNTAAAPLSDNKQTRGPTTLQKILIAAALLANSGYISVQGTFLVNARPARSAGRCSRWRHYYNEGDPRRLAIRVP
jgi:hypothetical protein